MERRRFRMGNVVFLFAAVMLCVSILAALTVVTAAADRRTAPRYGEYVQQSSACQNAGQRWLAEADAYLRGLGPLPADTVHTPQQLSTALSVDGMTLTIRLAVHSESWEVTQWSCRSQWQPTEESWSLWQP